MEDKKKCIPKIRFPQFTDDWEQRKWIDVVDISTEMVNPQSGEFDDMPHIAPGNIESFTGRILDNVKTVKEEQLISGKFRFRPNDVVYGKINPQLAKYFYSSVDGLTSADAYVFNSKNGLTQKFLYSVLQTKDFYNYSVSVSKRSGMPKINRDELNGYSFMMPNEAEQEQIGNFLLEFDNLITLHQRECENLKELKKGMLQKMFPKEGENVPEIRFPQFTDAWEQRKLGEIVGVYDGIHQTPNYQDSGIMFLSVENISTLQSNKFISEEDFIKNYKVYPQQNDILMTRIGDVGTTNVVTGNDPKAYYVSLALLKYKSTDPYFLSNAIQSDYVKKGLANRTLTTAVPMKINKDEIGKVDVMLPISSDEQVKIGHFFKELDNTITLHQREYEKLKELKKGLLQQMFV